MPFRRGIYYTEDSMDNWRLAKCHTRPKKDNWFHKPYNGPHKRDTIWQGKSDTPIEVLNN